MADIIRFISPLDTMLKQTAINKITSTNIQSQSFGLRLTETDALQIIESRDEALKTLGRVELGFDIIKKIIATFCHSPYLNQADYAAKICELVEAFYCMKNQTRDQIGDDDLIDLMRDRFDNRCFGSIELLIGRELERLAGEIRSGRYYGMNADEEEV